MERKDLVSHSWQFYRYVPSPGDYVIRYFPPEGWWTENDLQAFSLPQDYPKVDPLKSPPDIVFIAQRGAAPTPTATGTPRPTPTATLPPTAMLHLDILVLDQYGLPVEGVWVSLIWSTMYRDRWTNASGLAHYAVMGYPRDPLLAMVKPVGYACMRIDLPEGVEGQPIPPVLVVVDGATRTPEPHSCQVRFSWLGEDIADPVVVHLEALQPADPTLTLTPSLTAAATSAPALTPSPSPTVAYVECAVRLRIYTDGLLRIISWECE